MPRFENVRICLSRNESAQRRLRDLTCAKLGGDGGVDFSAARSGEKSGDTDAAPDDAGPVTDTGPADAAAPNPTGGTATSEATTA